MFKKVLSLILSCALLWTSSGMAQAADLVPDILAVPSNLPQLQLIPPSQMGRIADYYNAPAENSKLVILIQDLHAHYGVQKNISGILEFLSKKLHRDVPSPLAGEGGRSPGEGSPHPPFGHLLPQGEKEIPFALAVEGAQGPIDSSVMALFPEQKIKRQAADYLMRQGELTGAEYFAVMKGIPNLLTGVEDARYYNLNRDLFRQTFKDREELTGLLKSLQADLVPLQKRMYGSTLADFQKKVDAYEKAEMSTHEFVGLLVQTANPQLDLKKDFPVLASFASNSRFGTMEQVRSATAEFLTQIQSRLSPEEKKNLQLLAKKSETTVYYLYLRDLIYRKQLFLAAPPELAQYLEYLHTAQTMGMDQVTHEAKELAFKIKLSLARDAADLVRVEHDLDLLSRITDLQATEMEVKDFGPRVNQFVALCKSLMESNGLHSFDETKVRALISSSIDYYAMAHMRNKPMIDNTLALMGAHPLRTQHSKFKTQQDVFLDVDPKALSAERPYDVAVLVAGGFHTQPLAQLLRQKNISYIVITPTVENLTDADHELYIKRLNGKLLTVEEVLAHARKEAESPSLLAKLWSFPKAPSSTREDDEDEGKSLAVGLFGTALAGVAFAALYAGWAHAAGMPADFAHVHQFLSQFSAWAHHVPAIGAEQMMTAMMWPFFRRPKTSGKKDLDQIARDLARTILTDGFQVNYEQPNTSEEWDKLLNAVRDQHTGREGDLADQLGNLIHRSLKAGKGDHMRGDMDALIEKVRPYLHQAAGAPPAAQPPANPADLDQATEFLSQRGGLMHASIDNDPTSDILHKGFTAKIASGDPSQTPGVYLGQNVPRLEGNSWTLNSAVSGANYSAQNWIFSDSVDARGRVYLVDRRVIDRLPIDQQRDLDIQSEIKIPGVEGQRTISPQDISGVIANIRDQERELRKMRTSGIFVPLYLIDRDADNNVRLVGVVTPATRPGALTLPSTYVAGAIKYVLGEVELKTWNEARKKGDKITQDKIEIQLKNRLGFDGILGSPRFVDVLENFDEIRAPQLSPSLRIAFDALNQLREPENLARAIELLFAPTWEKRPLLHEKSIVDLHDNSQLGSRETRAKWVGIIRKYAEVSAAEAEAVLADLLPAFGLEAPFQSVTDAMRVVEIAFQGMTFKEVVAAKGFDVVLHFLHNLARPDAVLTAGNGSGNLNSEQLMSKLVSDTGAQWISLASLVGYMRDRVLTQADRPTYGARWLSAAEEIQKDLDAARGTFKPAKLDFHRTRQAAAGEQALVELVSNGFDAVDAWISRFGVGFYQSLGQLEDMNDRVYFAGETEQSQRIGIVFRLTPERELEVRPMTDNELQDLLGSDHQTTKVRVQKDMDEVAQNKVRTYFADRAAGSRRMQVLVNGRTVNSLEGFASLTEPSGMLTYLHPAMLRIELKPDGYTVSNSGQISPETLFEKVIVPRSGRTPGTDRTRSDAPRAPPAELLYTPDHSPDGRSRVTVSVAGMGVEVFELEGMTLPSRVVINLPPNITLNVSRDQIIPDAVFSGTMNQLVSQLDQLDNPQELVSISHVLMAYWQRIADRSKQQRDRTIAVRLREYSLPHLRALIRNRLAQETDHIVLPTLPLFRAVTLPPGKQALFISPELYDFDAQGIEGAETVEEFLPNPGYRAVHMEFDPAQPHPMISMIGKLIILDRKFYNEIKDDPAKRAWVDWWLNMQVGYGKPKPSPGWWNHPPLARDTRRTSGDPSEKLETNETDVLTNTESNGLTDRQKAYTALKPELSKRSAGPWWGTWLWELLGRLQGQTTESMVEAGRAALQAWADWEDMLSPAQPLRLIDWINELIPYAAHTLNVHFPGFTRVERLADGRLLIVVEHGVSGEYDVNTRPSLMFVETAPGSQQFEKLMIKIGSVQPYRSSNDKKSYVLNPKDGRIYSWQGNKLLRETSPHSFVLEKVKYEQPNERLNGTFVPDQLQVLPDGRLQFLVKEDLIERAVAAGSNLRPLEVWRETHPGSLKFELFVYSDEMVEKIVALPDGRILVRRLFSPSNSLHYREIFHLEKEAGSGEWIKIPAENLKFILGDMVSLPSGRTATFHNDFFPLDKENVLTYWGIRLVDPQKSNAVRSLMVQTERGLLSYMSDRKPEIMESPDGSLILYARNPDRLYRETKAGSGVLEEIPNTIELLGRITNTISGVFLLPDGRIAIASYLDNQYIETFPGSGQFEQVDWPVNDVRSVGPNGSMLRIGDPEQKQWLETLALPDSPPTFTEDERNLIRNFVSHYQSLFENEHDLLENFSVNMTLLGSKFLHALPLAIGLYSLILQALDTDSIEALANMVQGRSFEEQDRLLAFVQLAYDAASDDELLFNRYMKRWVLLVAADEDLTLANSLIDMLDEGGAKFLAPGADLEKASPQWLGIIRFFRDPAMATLPPERPAEEPPLVVPGTQTVARLDRTVSGRPLSLGRLLAFVRSSRDFFERQKGHLDLSRVLDQLSELEPTLDATSQEDEVRRTIRGQADGYAIWLRELIQNARDELRRFGQTKEPLRISSWFEGSYRVTRVSDPIGMSLEKLLTVYFPIDVSDKVGNLTGKLGQGNYSIWLDTNKVRLRTGDGTGKSYLIELTATRKDPQRMPLQIEVTRFEEYDDSFKGTRIEHLKGYAPDDPSRYIDAAFFEHALFRYLGDIRDVDVRYQGHSISEKVVPLAKIQDAAWGPFEVGWTEGVSRITEDGLEVRTLDESDWEDIPKVIRMTLPVRGRLLLRWPAGIPLTAPRSEAALAAMTPAERERFSRMRKAAMFLAAAEAIQQHGVRLPDMPEDILYSDHGVDWDILPDAERINTGHWADVDWTRYRDNAKALQLIMTLKARSTQMSLMDLQDALREAPGDENNVAFWVKRFPGVESKIDEAAKRLAFKTSELQRTADMHTKRESLGEARFPKLQYIFDSFKEAIGDAELKSQMSPRRDLAAFVQDSRTIHFSQRWAARTERELNELGTGEFPNQVLNDILDIFVHEYAHILESRELGTSSHLTHGSDGVIPNSFPGRMRGIIEKLIEKRWDLRDALALPAAPPPASLTLDSTYKRVEGLYQDHALFAQDLERMGRLPIDQTPIIDQIKDRILQSGRRTDAGEALKLAQMMRLAELFHAHEVEKFALHQDNFVDLHDNSGGKRSVREAMVNAMRAATDAVEGDPGSAMTHLKNFINNPIIGLELGVAEQAVRIVFGAELEAAMLENGIDVVMHFLYNLARPDAALTAGNPSQPPAEFEIHVLPKSPDEVNQEWNGWKDRVRSQLRQPVERGTGWLRIIATPQEAEEFHKTWSSDFIGVYKVEINGQRYKIPASVWEKMKAWSARSGDFERNGYFLYKNGSNGSEIADFIPLGSIAYDPASVRGIDDEHATQSNSLDFESYGPGLTGDLAEELGLDLAAQQRLTFTQMSAQDPSLKSIPFHSHHLGSNYPNGPSRQDQKERLNASGRPAFVYSVKSGAGYFYTDREVIRVEPAAAPSTGPGSMGTPASLFGVAAAAFGASPRAVKSWSWIGFIFDVAVGAVAWHFGSHGWIAFVGANIFAALHALFYYKLSQRGPPGSVQTWQYAVPFVIFNTYLFSSSSLILFLVAALWHFLYDFREILRLTEVMQAPSRDDIERSSPIENPSVIAGQIIPAAASGSPSAQAVAAPEKQEPRAFNDVSADESIGGNTASNARAVNGPTADVTHVTSFPVAPLGIDSFIDAVVFLAASQHNELTESLIRNRAKSIGLQAPQVEEFIALGNGRAANILLKSDKEEYLRSNIVAQLIETFTVPPAGSLTSERRAMNAWEAFRLGEWGHAWQLLFFKGNRISLTHSLQVVPSIELMLRQFAQSNAVENLVPGRDLSKLDLKIEMDTTMGRGQGAFVTPVYDDQRQLVGLTFQINAHLDAETMKWAAMHEMLHVLVGTNLKTDTQNRGWLESLITFFFRLIGISEEERLVTRATRQFMKNRPGMMTEAVRAAGQAVLAADRAGRPLAETDVNDPAMAALLGQLPAFAQPDRIRDELAAQREAVLQAA